MGLTNIKAALSGSSTKGGPMSGLKAQVVNTATAQVKGAIAPVLDAGKLAAVDFNAVSKSVSSLPSLGLAISQEAGASFMKNVKDGAPLAATTFAQQALLNPSDPFAGAAAVGNLLAGSAAAALGPALDKAQAAVNSLTDKLSKLAALGQAIPDILKDQLSSAQDQLAGLMSGEDAGDSNSDPTKFSEVPDFENQELNTTNTAKKTYDYGYPNGQSAVSTFAQKVDAVGQDGAIKYSKIPFIPTLAHHNIIWQEQQKDDLPILGIRKSQTIASRMSFKLEYRNIIMSLLVNPKTLNIARSQNMSNAGVRTGFLINPTGPGEFDITISGSTAGFYDESGLTSVETYTVAYSNLLFLYNFFMNNGYVLDDEPNTFEDSGTNVFSTRFEVPEVTAKAAPSKRINSMSYVVIEYQKWIWSGYFKSFKIKDSSEHPFMLNFDFTFRVCHESDTFKIDSSADVQLPAISGHVTSGYSAERNVAAQVSGDVASDDPLAINGNSISHSLARLWSFDDKSSIVPVALDPRKSHAEAVSDLREGGVTGEDITGPDGARAFVGTADDGTAVAVESEGNTRSVTVANSGSTPVNYTSTAEQKDPETVAGTVQVSPGGDQYEYETKGTVAPPAVPPDAAKLAELQGLLKDAELSLAYQKDQLAHEEARHAQYVTAYNDVSAPATRAAKAAMLADPTNQALIDAYTTAKAKSDDDLLQMNGASYNVQKYKNDWIPASETKVYNLQQQVAALKGN